MFATRHHRTTTTNMMGKKSPRKWLLCMLRILHVMINTSKIGSIWIHFWAGGVSQYRQALQHDQYLVRPSKLNKIDSKQSPSFCNSSQTLLRNGDNGNAGFKLLSETVLMAQVPLNDWVETSDNINCSVYPLISSLSIFFHPFIQTSL